MATARFERVRTHNIPMALFCYFILMWVPVFKRLESAVVVFPNLVSFGLDTTV